MIKHFLRLYAAVMIPVLVLVAVAHQIGTRESSRTAYVEGLRAGLQARFAAPRAQIEALRLDNWADSLPRLREAYPPDLRLDLDPVAFQRLASNPAESSRFEKGDVAFTIERRGLTHAYQRIPGTPLTVGADINIPSHDALWPTLYMLFIIAVASILALWVWFRPSWRALERLGLLTEEVASSPRAGSTMDGSAKFGHPLATTIDHMATRLDNLLHLRSTQSNSVAHELTAPISKLSFALEILKDNPNGANTPAMLKRMREDLEELDALVAESLEHARLGRTRAIAPDDASLNAMMQVVVDAAMKLPHHAHAIAMEPIAEPFDTVFCDRHHMERALFNLVRNAIKYARSQIRVSAERRGDLHWIHVDDDGPGIACEQRQKLFEPFTRAEDHTVGATRGYGLGLAIVRQVAELHGGVARIDTSPLGGARVSIGW